MAHTPEHPRTRRAQFYDDNESNLIVAGVFLLVFGLALVTTSLVFSLLCFAALACIGYGLAWYHTNCEYGYEKALVEPYEDWYWEQSEEARKALWAVGKGWGQMVYLILAGLALGYGLGFFTP